MVPVASFDLDFRAAFVKGGPLGAALEVLRTCFGWDGAEISGAEGLLAELQRPETSSLVDWRQDVVLSPPEALDQDLRMIAAENQSNWQVAQRPDGTAELGTAGSDEWQPWVAVDLGELLCRLLVTEAVVGHGPCLLSPVLPAARVQAFELLPPLDLPGGPAELEAVVATDRWFGIMTGTGDRRLVYAAPVDHARHELVPLAPDGHWHELP